MVWLSKSKVADHIYCMFLSLQTNNLLSEFSVIGIQTIEVKKQKDTFKFW